MLSQDERDLLQDFADRSPTGTPYLRRAQITLLQSDELSSEDIALQLNVPLTRVRQWQRVFDRLGIEAFPEEILLLEPLFAANDSITAAGLAIFRSLLARLLVLEQELENTLSVKSVHETRKNIRRLRTSLRLFDPYYDSKKLKRFQKRFRKIMRRLSHLRDYDVFLLKLERYMEEGLDWNALSDEDQPAFRQLDLYARESKNQVHKEAKAYFDKGKYRKLLMDFGIVLNELDKGIGKKDAMPAVSQASPALISEKAAAVHEFNDVTEEMSLERLHALRIEIKQLRYTMEFFEHLLGPSAAILIQEIKELLTHLGDLNDARVHITMIEGNEDIASNSAAVHYLQILEGELRRLRTEFSSQWAIFDQESWNESNWALTEI